MVTMRDGDGRRTEMVRIPGEIIFTRDNMCTREREIIDTRDNLTRVEREIIMRVERKNRTRDNLTRDNRLTNIPHGGTFGKIFYVKSVEMLNILFFKNA